MSNDIEGEIQAVDGRRIKVGLLGAGYILQAHAKALQATGGVEIRAVCDISRERAAEAAAAFDVPLVQTDLAELLDSDCDVIHVLLPPHLHVDVTHRILGAVKYCFGDRLRSVDRRRILRLFRDDGRRRVRQRRLVYGSRRRGLRCDWRRGRRL